MKLLKSGYRYVGLAANPGGLLDTLRSGLWLDDWAFFYMVTEGKDWNWIYIPPGGLEDKTVLDVGACCGETAYVFFKHGAKKVIAIEPDPQRCNLLSYNSYERGWPIEIYNRKFQLSDLDIPHDFMKVNIEGYELLLLDRPEKIGPCVVDVHNWYIQEKFSQIGFHLITKASEMLGQTYMTNYPVHTSVSTG